MAPAYVFKLRDISSTGMGVLVREDSDLLNQIEIGEVLYMKYNPSQRSDPSECLETEIKHITTDAAGSFKGHALVGLSIIENTENMPLSLCPSAMAPGSPLPVDSCGD